MIYTNNTINLVSTINTDGILEHSIFIMSIIGGLFSFLSLIFNMIISPILSNTFLIQVINEYNSHLNATKKNKVAKLNSQISRKRRNSVEPLQKSIENEGGDSDDNQNDALKAIIQHKRLDVSDSISHIYNKHMSKPQESLKKTMI